MICCPACTEKHQLQQYRSGACCERCHWFLVRRGRIRTKPWKPRIQRPIQRPIRRKIVSYIDLSRERFGT